MRKVFLLILFVVVNLQFRYPLSVSADDCDSEHPIFEGYSDIYYEIGQPTPDYLQNITVKDKCGNTIPKENINVDASLVKLNSPGVYNLYYQSRKTSVDVKVYVYEDIPTIEGLRDFYLEINSLPINYLEGVTAVDVFKTGSDRDLTHALEVDLRNIDYTKVGSYFIEYSVQDSRGNITKKKVKVYIEDTTKPVIKDYKDLTIEVNTNINTYDFWKDVTVTDNSNNHIIKDLNLTKLDIGKIGVYQIEYIAIDESQNETKVQVNVKVVDTVKPIIKNTKNLQFLVNSTLSKQDFIKSVTVSDNYDKNISIDKLQVYFDQVDTSTPGVYPVIYFLSDASGNSDIIRIDVKIYDEDIPSILNTRNLRIPVGTDSVDYLENISCMDETDGNLTNKIYVNDFYVNLSKIGTYPVQYIVFDSSGNYDVETIYVTVYDDEQPIIDGVEDIDIEVNTEYQKEYFLRNITAYDNVEGDITSKLDVDITNIKFNEVGTYIITYRVTDESGNMVEISANVNVIDSTPPVISNYRNLTIKLNEILSQEDILQGVSVIDNYDGDITSTASVKGFLNFSEPGVYTVRIYAVDENGNEAEVSITITVLSNQSSESDDGKGIIDFKKYSMFYVIGGIGFTLLVTGFLGYRSRRRR